MGEDNQFTNHLVLKSLKLSRIITQILIPILAKVKLIDIVGLGGYILLFSHPAEANPQASQLNVTSESRLSPENVPGTINHPKSCNTNFHRYTPLFLSMSKGEI